MSKKKLQKKDLNNKTHEWKTTSHFFICSTDAHRTQNKPKPNQAKVKKGAFFK